KIFPALHAMARRGHLNVPVVGVARSGVTLEQLKQRVRASVAEHGGVDETAFARLANRLRLGGGDYEAAATYKNLRTALGRARPAGPSPRHSTEPLHDRGEGARQLGLRARRPGDPREALRPRPPVGAGPERDAPRGVRRVGDLPHRPLPREGAGAEPPRLPL